MVACQARDRQGRPGAPAKHFREWRAGPSRL